MKLLIVHAGFDFYGRPYAGNGRLGGNQAASCHARICNHSHIALTANTGGEPEKRHMAAGCTQHIAKPVQSETLFAAIHQYLSKPSLPEHE